MLYTEIQPQSFLGSGEDFLSAFYHITCTCMGMVAMLFIGAELFEQIVSIPHVKSDENWSSGFREDILRLHNLYTRI